MRVSRNPAGRSVADTEREIEREETTEIGRRKDSQVGEEKSISSCSSPFGIVLLQPFSVFPGRNECGRNK
jgi:hypothetical protein